jgi:hypothetical protein
MRNLPNDSAISVATAAAAASSSAYPSSITPPPGERRASDDRTKSKSNSPQATQFTPYHELSPEEQAAQDLENEAAVAQAQASIDIDSGSDVASVSDAGYETDSLRSAASTSLSSSVRDFAFENGRRYHKFREGAYNFPNDDSEQEREDMKHAMMVNLCQKLHFAPIGDNPGNILDIGTGTGIWAIESECFIKRGSRQGEVLMQNYSGRFISKRQRPGYRFKSHTTRMGAPKC